MLFAGTRDKPDQVQRAPRLMPQATFIVLEGLDHAQAIARSDIVLPHVLAFLARTEDRSPARLESALARGGGC